MIVVGDSNRRKSIVAIIVALISATGFIIAELVDTTPTTQTSHGDNSPNIQGVEGGVEIIIDNERNSKQNENQN